MSLDTSTDERGDRTVANPFVLPPTVSQRPNVLASIYSLVERGEVDAALDELYDVIDQLLVATSYAQCDRLLKRLDLDRAGIDVVVGALSITLAARTRLPSRSALFARLRATLESRGMPDIDAVLHGLQ